MAILIKGMEMPRNCMACDFEQVDEYELSTECSLIYKGHTYKCRTEGRLPDCPLVEISDEQPDDTISRQDAIDALAKFVPYAICDESTESYTNGLTDAYNLICQLPSAHPEIIRCKDCKWVGKAGCAIEIVDDSDKPTEDDFCSFAERRTDDA